ncbi:localization factor PodJL [Pararhizobium capsulatum DSM 1112]|uniref:Localization factor PodJL n=1 Tax=Pararhizobium capsulatum DSM 1112 TaxID=1121113 RepID=A0ABU0BKU2_9HYPH|nr:peptidoglycan-binding protein [Pararhizobium capsulatum]MDQ0318871.1 localization factor PodJL [Pararhizobium capsulatum DSM 1112]
MNGSRPHNSRSGSPSYGGGAYGERSSLDALNRTIEGLESRIEGLMGSAARDPRQRPVEREMPQRPDPVSEILQRQRTLAASRDVAPDRPAPRSIPPVSRAQPFAEERRTSPLREALAQREALAKRESLPTREPLVVRPQPPLREPVMPRETYASRPAEPRPDPAIAEIAQSLLGLRQELKADIAEGLSREMAALRNEIRGITAEAAQGQVGLGDIRSDLQWLSESITQLGRQAPPAQADALKSEFDELRAMIEGLSREDGMRRMEDRWTAVENRLQHFDSNRDDELVALAYRLDEIKSQIGSANSSPAIHALEDKLVSMAQAVEMLGRHMQPDDSHLSSQFADLDIRLDEISRAIVTSGRTASSMDAAAIDRVENRLVDLAHQIDILSRPVDTGLGNRIEALAARVDQLANEEAAVRLEERLDQLSLMFERSQKNVQPDLTGYLSDISRKIDALDQGDVNEALAERLDDLARRIDALDAPSDPYPMGERFARLEGQLADIAIRLEETHAAPYDDSVALRGLQDQIANLSALVNEPRPVAAASLPVEFEGRMTALEDYLTTSDEYIIEAARQAAEAVMEAYNRNGTTPSTGGTDMAAISALAGDLKTLEELSRSSEERTARTFEALHETLVHIAEKLERLEEGNHYQEEPRAFGTRESSFAPPQMPKVAEPDLEDPFGPVEQYERLKRDMQQQASSVSPSPLMQAAAEEEVATALLEVGEVGDHVAPQEPRPAVRKSLLSGLTRRFSGKRAIPARTENRQTVEPTPSIDAADTIAPDVANELLEPGSGMPDVKKILERVRAGQANRGMQGIAAGEADKADFIAAARRAAQLAVEESDTISQRGRAAAPASSVSGAFARHRRPILMAVGAVLLAIMSYPLVNTLIRGERTPAPVAVIEQQVEAPTQVEVASAATTPADDDIAPLSSLQPQDGDLAPTVPEASAEVPQVDPAQDAAAASSPVTPAMDVETQAPGQGGADLLATTTEQASGQGSFAATPPETKADGFVALPKPVQSIDVPAEITQPALVSAIRGGDPLAFFEVGAIYTEGRGVKVDLVEAVKWYQRAADQGLVPAEYRLATLYEKGSGVTRDAAKAKALYLSAAEKGNASAMHNLAVILANGGDTPPDFAEAGKWFGKAAELGLRDSQFNLAILYARGNGLKQDLAESYKWFAVAAKGGDTDAAQKREDVAKAMKPEQLKDAKARFESWKPATVDDKANNVIVPDAWLGKSPSTATVDMTRAIRNIQAILNNNGFDAGVPDGKIGAKTALAITAFQKSIGQEPTGQINDALVRELLKRNG